MPIATLAAPASGTLPYWAQDPVDLLRTVEATAGGLTATEAAHRLETCGHNHVQPRRKLTRTRVLLAQLKSPLLLVLLFAGAVSMASQEWVDALVVSTIVVTTIAIGYWREYAAETAADALQARIRTEARVLRDARVVTVPVEDIVPGDVIVLSAGSLVPADSRLIEATDFFVNEAVLTGESFPTAKGTAIVAADAAIGQRSNCVFLGTNVRSGMAHAVVVHTGTATEYARIARRLVTVPPETEFERGLRRFGYFVMSAMLVLVFGVFIGHFLAQRPPMQTLLFAMALAVGLSPELLPAILTVNLARGAQALARHGVLVRRLNAIENLGSMDVLCTDKTGTLTEGVVRMGGAYDASGNPSDAVLDAATLNAALATGLANPLDAAILEAGRPALGVEKLAEIPFDFIRKRVSVVVATGGVRQLITKGAFQTVLDVCTVLEDRTPIGPAIKERLNKHFQTWSNQGYRVLAVAARPLEPQDDYTRSIERDLAFLGFLTFLDRPKWDAPAAIAGLNRLGVSIKIISGDTKAVVTHVAGLVGIPSANVLTGGEIARMSDEALWRSAEVTNLFVEVDPNQKERIIGALRRTGHVVGFLGDGINDAPAMHMADASLSVDTAVDVARAAADFVLLQHDLDVIRRGVEEGRRTFANTMKYILTTMSANLGNMVSMAFASLLLPFLPLLPGQILLNNLLSDVPAAGIADDAVDPEHVLSPKRWEMAPIARFMVVFGGLSSFFDFMTFGVLQSGFAVTPAQFRTGWFVESLLTELVIALVIRTRRPFWRSRPGALLRDTTVGLVVLALAVPYLPGATTLGFARLPPGVIAAIAAITVAYVAAAEMTKQWFFREPLRVNMWKKLITRPSV